MYGALLEGANVTTLIVAILGGGFLTGLIALLRFRVDKDAVIVTAAQGAVVVQTGVIDALQEELERLTKQLSDSRTEVTDLKALYESERVARQNLEDQQRKAGLAQVNNPETERIAREALAEKQRPGGHDVPSEG